MPGSVPEDNPFHPFDDRLQFETADFLYRTAQMSKMNIDKLMELWGASLLRGGQQPLFADEADLHRYTKQLLYMKYFELTRRTGASTISRVAKCGGSASTSRTRAMKKHLGRCGWMKCTSSGFATRTWSPRR
jgi:hypothetical protein